MNLVSTILYGKKTYGIVKNDVFYEASKSFKARYRSLTKTIEAEVTKELYEDAITSNICYDLNSLRFLPPITDKTKIICVGINYPKFYMNEFTKKPSSIILFSKFPETIVAHKEYLTLPSGEAEKSFDYEGEIAIVISKKGFQLKENDAMDFVLGYTIFNDGSVRDWQNHSLHAGKNFFHSSSCGPWITTTETIKDPNILELETKLNGKLVQKTSAKEMFFNIPSIISYISQTTPLSPGDIIATGSPEGTGANQNPPRFLKKHDILEVSISSIGELRNTVA